MLGGRKYLIFISYIGTGFRGSQRQLPGVKTVQSVIEEALKNVFRLPGERPIRVFIGSRTDSGVHALKAPVHVRLPALRGGYVKPESLKFRLNSHFSGSENVRVLEVYTYNELFNTRSAYLHKVYMLRVGVLKKEFFSENYVIPIMEIERTHLAGIRRDFDISKAREAASLFVGPNDFAGIIARPNLNYSRTICNIMSFEVEEAQPSVPFDPLTERFNFYNFICKGDRFLYLMVRRMVTLALSVGYSKIRLKDIEDLLRNPMPKAMPKTCLKVVSGSGLYLVDTVYDVEKLKLETRKAIEEENEIRSRIVEEEKEECEINSQEVVS